MGNVTADISVSLDGFIAGPGDGVDNPLGDAGERLHEWVFGLATFRERHGMPGGETNRDDEILEESIRETGAVVLGRRMFDNAKGWGDDPPFHVPVFVLTHETRDDLAKQGGTTFTFVNDGVESALAQARVAAGERSVAVGGGANTIQQFLSAGLLDELQMHIVPVLFGGGIRLFDGLGTELVELETTRVVESPGVTHLKFRIAR
ncbi:MAG: dihydrofolate reductase family protein [Actinobacteria bacterium]|nr:dihydrofolate reductase family protein [Actinomycetota bacterium]